LAVTAVTLHPASRLGGDRGPWRAELHPAAHDASRRPVPVGRVM